MMEEKLISRIQVWCNMTLWHWVVGSWRFEGK